MHAARSPGRCRANSSPPGGDAYWVTATVASDMTQKTGKREMATFRWTAIFEKQGGKWLIVHEQVSEPLP
jgi:ketosteroid isomerase-like protein